MEIKKEELRKSGGMENPVDCMIRILRRTDQDYGKLTHLHYHEYIELLYGLEGNARVWIGNRSYSMEAGDLLIVNAGEPHEVICTEGEASYYVIKFLPKLLYSQGQSLSVVRHLLPLWQKQVAFHPALRQRELEGSGVGEWVRQIRREWENRSAGYELIIHANIMQIFVWMFLPTLRPMPFAAGRTRRHPWASRHSNDETSTQRSA